MSDTNGNRTTMTTRPGGSFIGSRAMPELVYHAPKTLPELMDLIKIHGPAARIVAGCTDVIPSIRTGRWRFDPGLHLVDITKINALNQIETHEDMLKIGAGVTLTRILTSPDVKGFCPVLARAVEQMASLQVRNTATMGGNLCMASPAADTAPPLLVSDATVILQDARGETTVPVADFFTGPGRSVMTPGQMMTHICIPKIKDQDSAAFLKIGTRTAVIISVVSAAVRIGMAGGVCESARIALGSVAPTPVRVTAAEQFLSGKPLDDQVVDACAGMAASAVSPITDLRASAGYRKDVAKTLVKRCLMACRKDLT
ncbi:MAG: xanthine dehydrogenase family protein subunit M [Desulfotignum sp.]|nr:xanthine dehydrogenase family protein subunit M [Desulfotignum sp.]MCF8086941.1 xanthine dehydrogenase family protein subunit M [Desulfotignum sp.]